MQTHENKENPPRTPTTKQTDNSTKQHKQKLRLQNNNTPQRHETKRTDKARRSTSRTQDNGWTRGPTSLPLTPESKTRVLQTNSKERKKTKQTTKQHVPATHVSYQSTKHTSNKPKEKNKTSAGERGTRRPTKGRKEIPTPPSCRLAILPVHERVGKDGLSTRGGRGIPFQNLGTREPETRRGRKRQTGEPPDPLQITRGQDQQWILTPESSNGPGSPKHIVKEEKKGIETPGPQPNHPEPRENTARGTPPTQKKEEKRH